MHRSVGRTLLCATAAAALLAAPLVTHLSELLFAPTPETAAEYRAYLGLRCAGAPAALGTFVVLGWLLGLQDARRPLGERLCLGVVAEHDRGHRRHAQRERNERR